MSKHNSHSSTNQYWLLAAFPLGLFVYFVRLIPALGTAESLHWSFAWVPGLDVNLSFRVDGLSLLMALLVTGIGTLIYIFASGYLAGDRQLNRFYLIITLFMGSMLGLVLADSLVLVFIFWELTSITSYLLIGYYHEEETAQNSAQQALLVTGLGGLALLAGVILLAIISGEWELTQLLTQGELVREHVLYLPALLLILLGAFTKSAQFPFHFWLPNAMAGPTPVSAYLHSATMVKAGVYFLARLNPVLGGTEVWFYVLVIVGGVTGLWGAWLSWQKTDLKQMMAYSTISALGTLVFLIGIGSKLALEAAVVFLFVHSLYKGALFMVAGSVDHEAGTREVGLLGGLAKAMPLTLAGVLLAAVSMAGLPPMIGFVGKELIYESALESETWKTALVLIALFTNIFIVTAAAVMVAEPFFRAKPSGSPMRAAHEAPWTMWLGPLVLGSVALAAGLFVGSDFVSHQFFEPAASAVLGETFEVKLYLIPPTLSLFAHGLPTPLFLSIITVLAGGGFYLVHKRIRTAANRADAAASRFGPERGYTAGLKGLLSFATFQTRLFQNGFLRYYLIFVLTTLVALVGYTFDQRGPAIQPAALSFEWHEVLISIMIIAAAFMIMLVQKRLAVIAALGVVGYGIALLFIFYSAPDLAMTQFAVETLSVILFVLVLYRLPRFDTFTRPISRVRDAVFAVSIGILMTILALAASSISHSGEVSRYFTANSFDLAKGHNIVNVILVDFRGLDTLIEITVLSVAAIGVYGLLKFRRDDEELEE